MTYFARPNQPLHVHLENVSKIAGSFAKTIGLFEDAVLAGSLHDMADLQRIPYKSVIGLPDALEISLRR